MDYKSNGYINLAVQIVKAAIEDYRTLLQGKGVERISGERQPTVESIEKFFLSPWGQLLSGGHGEYIIRRVRREELGA